MNAERSLQRCKDAVKDVLIPPVRAYLRYAPFTAGKRRLWTRLVRPYLAWHSHDFVGQTIFGVKVAGNTTEVIQQYLYYFGVWEPQLTTWVADTLARGDTFIDVGANIGYYSLLASRIVGASGSVVAIEASPRIFRVLRNNLDRNRAENVRAANVAVSDTSRLVQLYRGPDANLGLTTTVGKPGFDVECEVAAAPLHEVLRPDEVKNARLVKVDVEGAEASVVAGMKPLLSSGRKDLEVIVEAHEDDLLRQGKRVEDLVDFFSEAGFQAYSLENDYSPLSYLHRGPAERPSRASVPPCQETLIFSRRAVETL